MRGAFAPADVSGVAGSSSSGELFLAELTNGETSTAVNISLGLGFNSAANRIAHSTHATIYALDAHTGKELWSSGDQIASFNHFSGLSVANGRVYIGTYDGTLYCFAVGAGATSAQAADLPAKGGSHKSEGVASAFRRKEAAAAGRRH